MSAIVVDGHIVHYEVLGRGRPLILLHGWVGSWRYWIPTMQAVSTEFRAYALDLWGFGDTDHVPERYTLPEQASLVARFMDELGILRAAFVGHGLGGLVALHLAHNQPQRAERLMLVNVPVTSEALHPRLHRDPPADLASWLLNPGPQAEPILVEAQKADPQALAGWMGAGPAAWALPLDAVQTPCLLVYGQRDPAVRPPQNPVDLLGETSQNHLITFDESGHFPMLDEAAKFGRLLADFLALPPGEPVSRLQLKEEWKRRVR